MTSENAIKVKRILSDRHYQTWPSWHIVYEWEDELSQILQIPIVKSPINKVLKKIGFIDNVLFNGNFLYYYYLLNSKKDYSLYFEMHPKKNKSFSNTKNVIPIIIDFFDKNNMDCFKKRYAQCPYLCIASLEVIDFLQEKKVKNKLIHFPISLPSIYKLNANDVFDKKYDIVLAGRINVVLWNYLLQYEKQHPDIEYLYQKQIHGELFYWSNKKGLIGKFHSRKEYINLIKSAKVSFYATPGIDGGEHRTNGFNPVTPRLFELLAAGCHIIARYPQNKETEYFQLNSLCPSIDSYNEFEKQLDNALLEKPPLKKNSLYLEKHYTLNRLDLLKSII